MLAIEATGLKKNFGQTKALDGLDLSVEQGTIFGLLGPNGAGKTTAVRILTTLLRADAGTARVAGLDVVAQAHDLRSVIGLTGQYAAVDELLTGRENLIMVARLSRIPKVAARERADEMLQKVDLVDAADRLAKTYSGGMRRRLDLAASLLGTPRVVFLDEPTTGLDPRSRLAMWEVIKQLTEAGTTVLLTTQYLEEADNLADSIVVMDHGKAIASGTPQELKQTVGGERVEAKVSIGGDFEAAVELMKSMSDGELIVDPSRMTVSIATTKGVVALAEAVRLFENTSIPLDDLGLRRPTLDEAFLKLTGHYAEDDHEHQEDAIR